MSARRLSLGFAVSLCAMGGVLTLAAASALATQTHPFVVAFNGEATGVNPFAHPSGVGVDESSGNVFLTDGGASNALDAFGPEGLAPGGVAAPYRIEGFAFNGEPSGVAVDNSTTSASKGDLYVADVAASTVEKLALNALTEEYELIETLSASPAFGEPLGVTVDPHGNVFVADYASEAVVEFDPAGSEIGRVDVSGSVARPSSVAVDAKGDLYVQGYIDHAVYEYAANGSGKIEAGTVPTEIVGEGATGVAVDPSSDSLYVALGAHVAEYGPGGVLHGEFGKGDLGASERVAVNSKTGAIYVADIGNDTIDVFGGPVTVPTVSTSSATNQAETSATLNGTVNPEGAAVTECFFEYGEAESYGNTAPCEAPTAAELPADTSTHQVHASVHDLRHLTTYHFRLLAANANGVEHGSDESFATPTRPTIEATSVANVTSASADLNARVDPNFADTQYRFQYGTTTAYGAETAAVDIGGGDEAVGIFHHLQDLTEGANYHYRVVASNGVGTKLGPDQTFTTFQAPEAGLPDGRVYEMVSPLDKNGGDIIGETGGHANQASADGEKVTLFSQAAFDGAQGNLGSNPYLATRGQDGWSMQNLTPPVKSGTYILAVNNPFKAFSSDLSAGLLVNGELLLNRPPIKNPPLPGTNAPAGYENFYLRGNEAGSYRALLTSTPAFLSEFPLAQNFYMTLEGVTPDLSEIVVGFSSQANQAPTDLDEWSAGVLTPVNVPVSPATPGETVSGAVLGSGSTRESFGAPHTISADGSSVFWSVGGGSQMYLREGIGGAQPRTLELPPGSFVDASVTGSKVLLSTGEVYEDAIGHEHRVADITGGAGGFGGELGASADLSKIYFVDNAVLPAAGANSLGQTPRAGENNLYLYREGASTSFIGTLYSGGVSLDQKDWAGGLTERTTRVTPDGESIVFNSQVSLTGYDNINPAACPVESNPEGRCEEIYLYDAAANRLACVSCNPSGEPPIGSSSIPAGNMTSNDPRAYYQTRLLSSDGSRVFFDSPEALVSQDTNGVQDVYEYENGSARLISTGNGGAATFFDADETGSNVFFTTVNQLVPGDTDQLVDLYDARVDGGFPAAATATACTGTGCQGVPAAPPIFATPSSVTAAGVGNFTAPLTAPPAKPKTAAQLRAERLAAALKKCHAKRGKKRATCEKAAHRKYGVAKKASANKRGK